MTVQILLDGPARPMGPRLARFLATLAGLFLIGIGVLGLDGLIFIAIFAILSGQPATTLRDADLGIVVCVAVALLGLGLGFHLMRGRRRAVLFLRRFGFDDATRAMTFAATRAIGRSWRLVTLDDEKVKAVGGPASRRRIAVVIAALALLLLVIFATSGFFTSIPSPQDLLNSMATWGAPGNRADSASELYATLEFPLVAVVELLAIGTTILMVTVAGVATWLLAMVYGFARRAEHVKTVRIRSQQDVRDQSRAITRRAGRVFAPRLVVATVTNPLWQQTVRSFAGTAAALIIDVSVPSENLRWEIDTLLPVMGRRCILIGRLDLLTTQRQDGQLVYASAIEEDIDGHDILAYRPDKAGTRRFSRALRATIEARTHQR